jgi:hypothetical protein
MYIYIYVCMDVPHVSLHAPTDYILIYLYMHKLSYIYEQLGVVTWRSEWLLGGGSSSSSSSLPSLIPALIDLYVYYAILVAFFGPSDAEDKLSMAFGMTTDAAAAATAPRE